VGTDLWIFGYGSLVWRPAFPFVEQATGHIRGYQRRFWQGSPDHRGTPERPGRVVTLTALPGERCSGVAFRVAASDHEEVLANLDVRESGGFERVELPFFFAAHPPREARVLVYVASPRNPNFLGPAPVQEMVAQIRTAVGESGSNADYVLRLAETLRSLAIDDPHVFELAERLGSDPPG